MYYVTINKQFNNKQFMQFCKKLWVRVPLCPLFQDGVGGRASASYAEGYGIPSQSSESQAWHPTDACYTVLGLLFNHFDRAIF